MIAGLATLKHMSIEFLEASRKLITDQHKHTQNQQSCLHLGAMPVRICPCSRRMLTWSALIHVRMVRDITEELDSCVGTSTSFMRRGSDLCATLVLECRASFQVRGTSLDPRPNLKSAHRTRHIWLKRSFFCSLQPQDEGPYMHMDMVDEFASMLHWLTDSFAIDPQDLSALLPRQKQCHLQIRTSRSWYKEDIATHGWTDVCHRTRHFFTVPYGQPVHATGVHCSQNQRWCCTPLGSVRLWRSGSCLTFQVPCRASFMCLQTP